MNGYALDLIYMWVAGKPLYLMRVKEGANV